MENILKRDQRHIDQELQRLEKSLRTFAPLLTALINSDYTPDNEQFKEIIYSRCQKEKDTLNDFLRERTVKKHPAIDGLPITDFMKKAMIKLPMECDNILALHKALPAKSEVLATIYKAEIINGELQLTDEAIQAIIDAHTIYANDEKNLLFKKATDVLEQVKKLQKETGVSLFGHNVVVNMFNGDLAVSEINPYAILLKK
jgi:hypothetical protein